MDGAPEAEPHPLRIVVVGHLDHGKSTLIGRLLNDSGALAEGHVAALAEVSRRRGMDLEWSFLVDALQIERDQGRTVETSEAVFRTQRRTVVVIDAPGHDEFLRNMITGASRADLAIAVVDVGEGLLERSRRHLYLLGLLGVRRVIVAVNKMDRVDYDAERFAAAATAIRGYLQQIGVGAVAIIPISARHGAMVGERLPALDWYHGPTVLEALDRFEPEAATADVLPLRFAVQDTYKFDERRIVAGRVESGVLRVGDMLAFRPSGTTARVASIEDWNQPMRRVAASAGDSIGITLDQRGAVARGDIASPASDPIPLAQRLKVRLFWLASDPLVIGRNLGIRLATGEYRVTLQAIEGVVDLPTLKMRAADRVLTNEIAEAVLEAAEPIPVDRYQSLPWTGRGVLLDGSDAQGGAIVLDLVEGSSARPEAGERGVSREERERRNRHRGGVLWLSGRAGAGKATLAFALERALFDGGMQAMVLDGDSLPALYDEDAAGGRSGVRAIRDLAAAAGILAQAGQIAIVSRSAPTRADRALARTVAGEGFVEIYLHADAALCQARDPDGGAASDGASGRPATSETAEFEPPLAPELEIDTGTLDIAQSVDRLIAFVDSRLHDPRIDLKLVEPEWSV